MTNPPTSTIKSTLRWIAAVTVFFVLAQANAQAATVSGTRQKWQPIDVDFNGPAANEQDTYTTRFLIFASR